MSNQGVDGVVHDVSATQNGHCVQIVPLSFGMSVPLRSQASIFLIYVMTTNHKAYIYNKKHIYEHVVKER